MLLANGESGVGVQDARSGALGVALGDSVPQRLTVDFFSPTASVKPGDRLITSGLGGVFPVGLPVAQVLSTSQGPTGLITAASRPIVDPTTVTDVLVLEQSAP
jgi:rod shape-determining protein MreC